MVTKEIQGEGKVLMIQDINLNSSIQHKIVMDSMVESGNSTKLRLLML